MTRAEHAERVTWSYFCDRLITQRDCCYLTLGDGELLAAEEELQHAVRVHDRVKVEELVAKDFRLTNPKGLGVVGRAEWIDYATRRFTWDKEFEFSDVSVHQYGDSAVVISKVKQRGNFEGKDVSGEFFSFDVWVKGGGRWQIVSRHSDRIL